MRTSGYLLLALSIFAAAAVAADRSAGTSSERFTVAYDEATDVTRIRVPARNGRFSWSDVLLALARVRGYDDTALEDLLPEGEAEIDALQTRLLLTGVNLACGKGLQFRVVAAETPGAEPALEIAMDRVAVLASRRYFTRRIRAVAARLRGEQRLVYGLRLDDNWQDAEPGRDLVVVIHGWQSSPEAREADLEPVRKAGFPGGLFRYANDGPIDEAAGLLSAELKAVRTAQAARGVTLLTHSMGGLVARAVIENPDLDPGNVKRLIMLAPPSQGSLLAEFGFGLDVAEFATRPSPQPLAEFYAAVEDGLCEASVDLTPKSPFLNKLNARPRNPNVLYSIFLGTAGPMSEADLARMRDTLKKQGDANRYVRFFSKRLDTMLADLEEVRQGLGDGVVAVKRGRLAGVDDEVLLPFTHNFVLTDDSETGRQLQAEVLKRITRSESNGRKPTS